MNDFILTLVDWPEMLASFKKIQSGFVDNSDPENTFNLASEFLRTVIMRDTSVQAYDLLKNPAAESFKYWSFYGEIYSKLRKFLPLNFSNSFDKMYLPFIAPWTEGTPSEEQLFQLPSEMNVLKIAALSVAINPDTCREIAELGRKHTFSLLMHISARKIPPPPPGQQSTIFTSFANLEDPDLGSTHSNLTELTESWRQLFSHAAGTGKGLIATFEI